MGDGLVPSLVCKPSKLFDYLAQSLIVRLFISPHSWVHYLVIEVPNLMLNVQQNQRQTWKRSALSNRYDDSGCIVRFM